jgi:hypothetical protein
MTKTGWGRGYGYCEQHIWQPVEGYLMMYPQCQSPAKGNNWLSINVIDLASEAPKCQKCLKIEQEGNDADA